MNFKSIADAKRQTGLSYLGSTGVSAKLIKNEIKNNTLTYCIYLAPANTSGYNVCTASTPECRKGCLATSGRAKIEKYSGLNRIENARITKSKLFFEEQEFFMQWLIAEINLSIEKAIKKNMDFAVRLNGTSDIDWANVHYDGKNIFEHFPHVQFYDYTKNPKYFINKPSNYHLTLSYTGKNWLACKYVLAKGHNVAMVFNISPKEPMPVKYRQYTVVNGDLTDLRSADSSGVIVGLSWKNITDKKVNEEVKTSIFVVQKDDSFVKF